MTIPNYFEKILKRQREIKSSFPDSLNPPADKKQIKELERSLGFKFTKELKDLYLFANGSQTNPGSGIDNYLIPLHRFLSLTDAFDYYNHYIQDEFLFSELFENWATSKKPGKHLFPFIADDIHCYWIDLNTASENYGKLYSAINSGFSPEYEFSSLTIFFKIVLECYNKDIFFLESENNFLACDFERYFSLCKKLNPDIEYWKVINKIGNNM